MTELSSQMMAARGAALQTEVDAALALKADQTALDAVAAVADAVVTPSELATAIAPLATQTALDAVSAVADAAVTPGELTAALVPYAVNLDLFTTVSGATYTVQATDLGKVLRFTSGAAVTVTLPGSLGAGFNCLWRQAGAGQLTFTPAAGQTMRSFGAATQSAGQYAEGALAVDASNDWYLSGTLA